MSKSTSQYHHLTSIDDVSEDWLLRLFSLAKKLKKAHAKGVQSKAWLKYSTTLTDFTMISLFYEASTRTRLSGEAAMVKLGGNVIGTEAARLFSSVTKGETLGDTIENCAGYGEVIVLRHNKKGSAESAARLDVCPVINAGDGRGEHPTQALLDFKTIWEQFAGKKGKTLTLVGDLKNGRTVHSVVKLVALLADSSLGMINKVQLVAPKGFGLPRPYRDQLDAAGVSWSTSRKLTKSIVQRSDVVYMTRAQSERMKKGEKLDGADYRLTKTLAKSLPKDAIIMHPLPRNAELPKTVDRLPQARYFEQSKNGLFVRMALLLWVFGKTDWE